MISVQNLFSTSAVSNVTTGNTLSVTADSLGYDYITAYFSIGAQTNATAVPSIIGLQSGTTTTGPWSFFTNFQTNVFTPYTNAVSAFNYSNQTSYSTANTSTSDTLAMGFDIRNGVNRYWKALVGGVGYTQPAEVTIILSRPEASPYQSTSLTNSTQWGTAIQPMFG